MKKVHYIVIASILLTLLGGYIAGGTFGLGIAMIFVGFVTLITAPFILEL